MDFFEVIEKRRSIRRFTEEPVPEEVMKKAFHAAILAPNSSNTQTWNFYWVRSPEMRQKLIKNSLSQSAARTAQELVVVSADPALWRRSQASLVEWTRSVKAPLKVILYYEKLIPHVYRWGFFNSLAPFKWLLSTAVGFFRPTMRGPFTRGDIQEVAIKSAALAAENFVLAITAQGFASCMMEGFDEWRVKRQLRARCSERILMVIGIGREAERGTWGPQKRLPLTDVLKEL